MSYSDSQLSILSKKNGEPTHKELSEKISDDVKKFLENGGEIEILPDGATVDRPKEDWNKQYYTGSRKPVQVKGQ